MSLCTLCFFMKFSSLHNLNTKSLTSSFASHDHSSSIRSLATCGHYLASGASDDRIIIYDLKSRKEHCMLTHHESTLTALAFTNNHSHIISASQDGALAIVRCGNWQVEKLWEKAHKGAPILDIAVHHSGKLAFTLATDYTLHTWNLVKGRTAYILNLGNKVKDPKSLERIMFAPDDVRFLIVGGKYTEIWSIELGGVLKVIEHEQRVTSCLWLDNDNIFVGYEDGIIATIDINDDIKNVKKAHDARVKAAKYFEGFITTASSNGEIKVWTRKLKEVAKIDTGCRLTCLCVAPVMYNIKKEEDDKGSSEVVYKKTEARTSRVVVEIESSDDSKQQVIEEMTKKRKKKIKEIQEEVAQELQVKKTKKKKLSVNSLDDKYRTSKNDATVTKIKKDRSKKNIVNSAMKTDEIFKVSKNKKKKNKIVA